MSFLFEIWGSISFVNDAMHHQKSVAISPHDLPTYYKLIILLLCDNLMAKKNHFVIFFINFF